VLADRHFELDHDAGVDVIKEYQEGQRRAVNAFLVDSAVRPW
jgi:hypothetical protein